MRETWTTPWRLKRSERGGRRKINVVSNFATEAGNARAEMHRNYKDKAAMIRERIKSNFLPAACESLSAESCIFRCALR